MNVVRNGLPPSTSTAPQLVAFDVDGTLVGRDL